MIPSSMSVDTGPHGFSVVALAGIAGLCICAPAQAVQTREKPGPGGGPLLTSSLVRLGPADLGLIAAPLGPAALERLKRRLKSSPAKSPRRAELLLSLARHHHAKGQTKQAEQVYTRIAREPAYSSFGRMDEVLFFLAHLALRDARARTRTQGVRQARSALYQLIRDHPTSRYVPHVYLVFGEHYIDRKGQQSQQAAVRLLQQAARYPHSTALGYATYLKGWCQLKQARSQDALAAFVEAVRWARVSKIPAKARLLGAARGAMVKAFAQVAMPAKARAFFARVGGRQTRGMLLLLAGIYHRDRRPTAAKLVQAQAAAMATPKP